MNFMYVMRNLAWLACAVVLSQTIFLMVALWVMTGQAGGTAQPILVLTGLSVMVGAGLCWCCSKRSIFFMGAAIALYMPARMAFYWIVAFIQDVFRGAGLPGESIKVMSEQPQSLHLILAYVVIGLFAMAGGLLVKSRFVRGHRQA